MYYLKIDGKKVRPEKVTQVDLFNELGRRLMVCDYNNTIRVNSLVSELIELNRRYSYAQ